MCVIHTFVEIRMPLNGVTCIFVEIRMPPNGVIRSERVKWKNNLNLSLIIICTRNFILNIRMLYYILNIRTFYSIFRIICLCVFVL